MNFYPTEMDHARGRPADRCRLEMEEALRQGGADIQSGPDGQFLATMRKFQFVFSFPPAESGDPDDCPVRITYAGFAGGRVFPDLPGRNEIVYLRLSAYLNELNRDSGAVKYFYDGQIVRAELSFDYHSLSHAFAMLTAILKEVKRTRRGLGELLEMID